MNRISVILRGLWQAICVSTDGYCEKVVVCRTRRQPSGLTRDGNALRKQSTLVRYLVAAYNFFFLNMFDTHKHSNDAVTHPVFNYMFQRLSFLHWQG
jgi:hypothetical protein